MSYPLYKVLHIFGAFLLFAALGGMTLFQVDAEGAAERWGSKARKLAGMTHGIALLLLLFTGFGALATLGAAQQGIPLWVWLKLAIWLLLGGVIVLLRRSPGSARLLWWVLPILGGCAAFLAIYKPA